MITLDHAVKMADVAVGVTAVISVLVLFFKGRQEVRRWHHIKQTERRAEAAALGIVATYDLLAALDVHMKIGSMAGDESGQEGQRVSERMLDNYQKRYNQIEPQAVALERARVQALIFLSDEQCNKLEAVAGHYKAVWTDITTWFAHPQGQSISGASGEAYHRLTISSHETRVALRKDVLTALRDTARCQPRY